MLRIILIIFAIINVILLGLCTYLADFNILLAVFTFFMIYFVLLKKVFMTMLDFIRHPFKTTAYLITKIISVVLNYVRTDILIFGPFIIELILPMAFIYVLLLPLKWFFLIKILIAYIIVGIIYEWKRTSGVFFYIHNKFRTLYANFCYWYMFFKNIADTIYEDLHHIPSSKKVSPEEFKQAEYENTARTYKDDYRDDEEKKAEKKRQAQYEKYSETNSEARKKESLNKTIRRLNMTYKDELRVFGLLGQNFTEEDLKRRYKELVKQYHPDNYHNEAEAKVNEKYLVTINKAYSVLRKEMRSAA